MTEADAFKDFAVVWSMLSSALIFAMACGVGYFRPKTDCWAEHFAAVARENIETSRISRLRALSAAPDFARDEIEEAA